MKKHYLQVPFGTVELSEIEDDEGKIHCCIAPVLYMLVDDGVHYFDHEGQECSTLWIPSHGDKGVYVRIDGGTFEVTLEEATTLFLGGQNDS